MNEPDGGSGVLRRAGEAGPDCLDVERLSAETLTAGEQEHIENCARCQAEQALWREFVDDQPLDDEGAAVGWIVADLARRRRQITSPVVVSRWSAWLRPPIRIWASAFATLAVVAAVGFVVWDREPSVRAPTASEQGYRGAKIDVLSPIGDVADPPTRFEWSSIPGAVTYEVELLEVDRTVLWATSTDMASVVLPSRVSSLIVPRKTLLWQVRAKDRSNQVIAESGLERFRVQPASTKE